MKVYDSVKRSVEGWTSNWGFLVEEGEELNQGFDANPGSMFEAISARLLDTKLAGSAGSGFDTAAGDEVKSAVLAQAKLCECGAKVSFFSSHCHECGSENLKTMKDSRWGINAESHFKYIENLRHYVMFLLEPTEYHYSCRTFRIRSWLINKNDKNFNDIMKTQLDSGKKPHKNFMPLSYDFYISQPVLVLDGVLEISKYGSEFNIDFCDIDNGIIPNAPFEVFNAKMLVEMIEYKGWVIKNKSMRIQKAKLIEIFKNKGYNDINVVEFDEVIGAKKSTHGKDRGITERRVSANG